MGRTAAYVYHKYQDETTFLTQPGSLPRVIGLEPRFTNIEIKENLLKLSALNQNTIANYAWARFEGSGQVDFTLSNAWWLSWIFGAPSDGSIVNGHYTHTYGPAMPKAATSFSLEIGFSGETANVQRDFNGCIMTSMNLSTRINEVVKGSCQFLIGKEVDGTTLDSNPPSDSDNYPFTFVQAKLQAPNGTTLAEVQDVELNFNINPTLIYGLNSANPVSNYRALTELSGKFTLSEKDNTWLANVTGRASVASLTLIFDNGLTNASQRTLTITLNTIGLDLFDVAYNPNELVLDSVPFVAQNINTCTMVDGTATPP